ncbi:DUF6645 domain-containing protein, partial [Escherichia coli]
LAEKLTHKLKEGWQPFGSPVAITPYTLMQAIAAEGDVTTPVVVPGTGDGGYPGVVTTEPDYYYVIPLAGQSNGMAYGEGLPLPQTYDRPDPRIKQLARRSTVTPDGAPCKYNDIIPADHCLHDVQDMSRLNHPKADLSKGQYGTVGQGLHIAKKLLPFIPANAGILLVPCCRGGSAFTTGADGTYSDVTGASESSTRWGVGRPLYKDLIGRTKAALAKNPKNVLLAVVWMQGEFDFDGTPANHTARFTEVVEQYRTDLADMVGQCAGGSADGVPWICGDTTYFWKQKSESTYQTVYGSYKNKTEKNIHFVPFMTDENGANVPTNKPEEDPDIPASGYYGAASRTSANWTSADRASHFSSWARRGIISDRLASAILLHAGRTAELMGGEQVVMPPDEKPSPDTPSTPSTDGKSVTTLLYYRATESGGLLNPQGWGAEGGRALVVDDAGAAGGKALRWTKQTGSSSWFMQHDAGNGADLLASFYVQSDATDLNVMYHKGNAGQNTKLGSFGAFDNEWHTLGFRFAGNNSIEVTPVIDGKDGTPFMLSQSPVGTFTADKLRVTDITSGATYPVLIESITVEVNNP